MDKMHVATTLSVHHMVIKRINKGWPSHKVILDYLKLHLHESYSMFFKILTKGFFKGKFLNEEGTKAIMKLNIMEWNGMTFVFSRWKSQFDS
jgi:hypothetical protein